jgi:hypothetical protein
MKEQRIEYHDQTKEEKEQLSKYEQHFIPHDPYGTFSEAVNALNKRISYLDKIIKGIPLGYYDYKLTTGYEGTDLSLESLIEMKEFYGHSVEEAVGMFDGEGATLEDERDLQNKVEAYINIVGAVFLEMVTIIPDAQHKRPFEYLESLVYDLEKIRDIVGKRQDTFPKSSLPKPSLN